MRVIDKILELAKQKGVTANKVAVECKFTATAMSDWKKGKSQPSVNALMKIADYFDVSIDFLVGRTEQPYLVVAPNTNDPLERARLEGRAEALRERNKIKVGNK